MQCLLRIKRELEKFQNQPPPGISCWATENIQELKASVIGPSGTPYEDGIFHIDIQIPDRYPFVPPNMHFKTPIYHPNIDDSGRICLDILKMPPQGAWKPSLNLSSTLISIQVLMAEPNFKDPLMTEIAQMNYESFVKHAKEWTTKHAKQDQVKQEHISSISCGKTGESDSKRRKLI
ncbi:ubiquitin-conjugating enzyme E2 T-like isoform X2 [Stegodyphus dumicola]|nr:ubiquitin-conjugating enzyme E2 T-like isoform X2 [Stegodyphus dumicola]